MDYRINIWSYNQYNEREWTEVITARTQRAARSKATRWLNRQLFGDFQIEKDVIGQSLEFWVLK